MITTLASELNVSPIVSRVMINRGISSFDDAEQFLRPQLTDLFDPYLLAGMEEAGVRIQKAVNNREKILIYGDFDADGVTSTALLLHFFKLLNCSVTHYIPNRISEGYSFTAEGIQAIKEREVDLVISVDNGINSLDEIAHLKQNNIDVIITDHHEPPDVLPDADAIINPKCKHCTYPFKQLSGVGVAFKLAWGVAQHISKSKQVSPEFKQFLLNALAWVALGTITDLVPLVSENRIFAKFGLPAIQNSPNPGMRALCDIIGTSQLLVSEDISFRIGPRINAAGRLGRVGEAIDLFLTESYQEALVLAASLDEMNKERQTIERKIFEKVVTQIGAAEEDFIITGDEGWHPGVIGVVASKLVEEYGKPVILISFTNDKGRGSGRSVPGFDIYQALHDCADMLETYGGHSSAGGLTIMRDVVDPFKERISAFLKKSMPEKTFQAQLNIDCEIQISALSPLLLSEIDKLRPFGEANPMPVFATPGVQLARPAHQVGRDSSHLSFIVRQANKTFKAIAFNRGSDLEKINDAETFSIAYTPKMNFFNGRSNLELEIKDIHYDS
ncbi:MAG: single-stranded-DNA-specific exonuclease RecJ [Planctomycetota bacterium]